MFRFYLVVLTDLIIVYLRISLCLRQPNYKPRRRTVSTSRYDRLVRNMDEDPALEGEDVVYGAEIITAPGGVDPDTVLLVTEEQVTARPIAGMEAESALEFTMDMDDIEEVECEGMFADSVSIGTGQERYTISAQGMDAVDFTCAVVEQSNLKNRCERLGFGRTRFTVCKWSTCLGCALILVGIGFSVTMIGILVGLPFIGIGASLLVAAFAYKKLGEMMEDNVWTREDVGPSAI